MTIVTWKIDDGQVILLMVRARASLQKAGIHRFEGTVGANIKDLFVLKGINKYLLMSDKGTQRVRLTK
mgnify:CR=1 FL=1